MKLHHLKIFFFVVFMLSSVFVLTECSKPEDPYKDIRIREGDSPEVAFKKRVQYFERKILEHSEFEDAKNKYGIKKWGESLKADIKNPLVQLSTGECFDLSKLPEPWFVSHIYTNKEQKEKQDLSQGETQYQMVEYFDIDARMRDLKLPFLDIVESDIFIDRLQEYMYVRVISKPTLVSYVKKFGNVGNFTDYQSKVNAGVWRPSKQPALKYGEWSFDWYIFNRLYPDNNNVIPDTVILTDLSKQAILMGISWDIVAESVAYHTDTGYPINASMQLNLISKGLYSTDKVNKRIGFFRHETWSSRPSVSFGKRVFDNGYGYQIMFPALSTPYTAKVFSNVDAVIEKLQTECK